MVMPIQTLQRAITGRAPIVHANSRHPIEPSQFQPASLDVRLGNTATAVQSAFVPRQGNTVEHHIENKKKYRFDLHLDRPKLLHRGQPYVVELMESCALPDDTHIEFSPKSSIGRCDVFVRMVCDKQPHYDLTPPGYHGPLYAEITPLSFDVEVKAGLSLMQGRFKSTDTHRLRNKELKELHIHHGVLYGHNGEPLEQRRLDIRNDEVYFHVDLQAEIVGFVAKSTVQGPLRLFASERDQNLHDPQEFWEPLRRPKNGEMVLVPGNFYLLQTVERTRIPPGVCGQVSSFNITTGEIRPHYAGFFDPGFGGSTGTNGVLEVRAHEVPFNIFHGQPICSMYFEAMEEQPAQLYKGNYNKTGPSLSKHFKDRYDAWTREFWRTRW